MRPDVVTAARRWIGTPYEHQASCEGSGADLAAAERGLDRHYRIGAAHLPFDDASYVHAVFAGQGVGLRPYAPVHLQAVADGDVAVSWVRRTRVEGDVWLSYEVPLGEDREAFLPMELFCVRSRFQRPNLLIPPRCRQPTGPVA